MESNLTRLFSSELQDCQLWKSAREACFTRVWWQNGLAAGVLDFSNTTPGVCSGVSTAGKEIKTTTVDERKLNRIDLGLRDHRFAGPPCLAEGLWGPNIRACGIGDDLFHLLIKQARNQLRCVLDRLA